MDIIARKKALRMQMKQAKAALSPQQMQQEAQEVFAQLRTLPCIKNAHTLLLYWSLPDELPTHQVVEAWAQCKRVLLPRVVGNHLHLHLFEGSHTLVPVPPYGILEPIHSPRISPHEVDGVVMPGVAFDKQGHRLGRGRGFYDRLLPHMPHAVCVGVGLACQLVESVPVETHDVPLTWVVTPQGAYHTD